MASPNYYDKWRFTLYSTLVLVILFNTWTYKMVDSLLGSLVGSIASKDGCPTILGFGIHVLLFTLVIRYIMDMDL
jgi:hypothetical protein